MPETQRIPATNPFPVAEKGTVSLSGGTATIDTGVAITDARAKFMVALAPETADADVAADIRADSVSGNYEVDIQETDTSVGTVSVRYTIYRVD